MRSETKGYIRYHIARNVKPFLFILAVSLIATLVLGSYDRVTVYSLSDGSKDISYNLKLETASVIAAVVCYFQVSAQLSVFKKRRSLDCYYSLPLSRRTLGTVHFLTGLGITLVTYTACYIINILLFIPVAVTYAAQLNYILLIPHYLVTLLTTAAIYSVLSFAYDRGNTAGDGRWMMTLYTFLPSLISGAVIETVINGIMGKSYYNGGGNGIAPLYLFNQAGLAERAVLGRNISTTDITEGIVWPIVWLLLGAAAAVGFVLMFGAQPAHRTEELSDSPFAYKTLIPAFTILGAICFHDIDIVGVIIIGVLAVIGYVVYRRGFRLKKEDAISLVASLAISLLIIAIPY